MKTYPKYYVSHPVINGSFSNLHRLTPYTDRFEAQQYFYSHLSAYPEGLLLRKLNSNKTRNTILKS